MDTKTFRSFLTCFTYFTSCLLPGIYSNLPSSSLQEEEEILVLELNGKVAGWVAMSESTAQFLSIYLEDYDEDDGRKRDYVKNPKKFVLEYMNESLKDYVDKFAAYDEEARYNGVDALKTLVRWAYVHQFRSYTESGEYEWKMKDMTFIPEDTIQRVALVRAAVNMNLHGLVSVLRCNVGDELMSVIEGDAPYEAIRLMDEKRRLEETDDEALLNRILAVIKGAGSSHPSR